MYRKRFQSHPDFLANVSGMVGISVLSFGNERGETFRLEPSGAVPNVSEFWWVLSKYERCAI
jgi:hypothetical protein